MCEEIVIICGVTGLRINQNKEQSKEESVVKCDEEIESFQAEFHDLIHC